MLVIDRQSSVDLKFNQKNYSFSHMGKIHKFSELDHVHQYFRQNSAFDTIKFTYNGQKHYVHFWDKEVEVYSTKRALQRTLSQEGGGTWIEEKAGKKRYFVEEKGWLSSTFKEVSAEDCAENPSVWQKVLGLGLGILALAPGVSEFARRMPISKEAAGLGLLATQPKNPLSNLLALSLMPRDVFAQNVTNSTEFQVNSFTNSSQENPSVASLNDGGFVVTWVSNGQDGDLEGIYGQRYDANGAQAGTEFKVNTNTTNIQQEPSVAPLNDGGFVVTWQSIGQDGSGSGIYGQRYDATGAQAGAEFQVNTYMTNWQQLPSVAPLNDGGFVVTWTSDDQDGDASPGIYGQRYNATGAQSGAEFQVNTYTTGPQLRPSVASLNDGGVVVTWVSFNQDGDSFGIYGQRYDATGAQAGAEFQVNTYTTSSQGSPSVAPLNDGGFVVTWDSAGQDGDTSGIYGQRYNVTGAQAGTEFQVNTYITDGQRYPSVAPLNDGGFVVTWESFGQDGDREGIYGQRYNATGAKAGTEFQVNTYTISDQASPSVASLNDGGFIVTWASNGPDGDGFGILGQRFTGSGYPIPLVNTEFEISTSNISRFDEPRVAMMQSGGFFTLWTDDTRDSDDWGIFGQIYDQLSNRFGSDFQVNNYTTSMQDEPNLVALSTGRVVIVWKSNWQDGDTGGIYGQVYNPDGSVFKGEFLINTYTTSYQELPSVAPLSDGGFIVIWSGSIDRDGSLAGVYAQRFDLNGTVVGSEFQVNTFTTSYQHYADIAGFVGGGWTTVWQSQTQDGDSGGIFAQIFARNGSTFGPEFQINSYTAGHQSFPRVCTLNNGDFVVVWESDDQDGDLRGVYSQRFDGNGTRLGTEFRVNDYTLNQQYNPRIASLVNGGFVITWESFEQDGDSYGVFAKRYRNDGSAIGSEFQVNANSIGEQRLPDVSALSDGGFVIIWRDRIGTQYSIYAQRYDASGNRVGPVTFSPTPTNSVTSAFSTVPSTSNSMSSGSTSLMASSPYSTSVQSANTSQTFSSLMNSNPSTGQVTDTLTQNPQASVPSIPSQSSSSIPYTPNQPTSVPQGSSPFLPPSTQIEDVTEPGSSGFPGWAWGILGAGAAACVGVLSFVGYKVLGKRKPPPEDPLEPSSKGDTSIDSETEKVSSNANKANVELKDLKPEQDNVGSKDEKKGSSETENVEPLEKNPSVVPKPQTKESLKVDDSLKESTLQEEDSSPKELKPTRPSRGDQVNLGPYPINKIWIEKDNKTYLGPKQEYEILETVDIDTRKKIEGQTGFALNFKGYDTGSAAIGSGAYGAAYIARQVATKEYVALKEVQKNEESLREAQIHYQLRGVPNVIPFYDGYWAKGENKDVIFLITPLAAYGSGKNFTNSLYKLKNKSDQKSRILIEAAKDLSRGVAGMNAERIYHLDLKWDNVVFDKHGKAFVIDLGKAQLLANGKIKNFSGKIASEYAAPEVYDRYRGTFKEGLKAEKIDAWGLGTCLLNFVLGKDFFKDKGAPQQANGKHELRRGSDKEFENQIILEMGRKKWMPEGLRAVLIGLLKIDPKKRCSAQEAMEDLEKLPSYENSAQGRALQEEDYAQMQLPMVEEI